MKSSASCCQWEREMGKDTRNKHRRDVVVLDVSTASIGVRTRAKTLDIKRRQSSPTKPAAASSQPKSEYLELRSRNLLKPPFKQYLQNWGRKASPERENENPQLQSPGEKQGTRLVPQRRTCIEGKSGGFAIGNLEIEASLGENYASAGDRSTRESTTCSSMKPVDAITTPVSSTKKRSQIANLGVQNAFLRNIPTFREMEEFFSNAEQQERHYFIEKYNFDIMNDLPLPGRFEWVRVMP